EKQGVPGHKWEIEIVPLNQQDKKTPKKVENVEDLNKLLAELEKLQHLKELQHYAEAIGKAQQLQEKTIVTGGKSEGKLRLGVAVEGISPAMAEHLNVPPGVGVLVTEVMPGTPAEKAGIKNNDILLKIDGAMVPSGTEDFTKLIASLKTNVPLDVVVIR